jgi:Zn-dependent peptidase ImmA (M78 family)|uniref:IrrE protein n=1 Tax=Siphoviridae sp. ctnNB1 TaxID=2825660 RepID=A0A8S5UV46_9CAUD|nr:MAG TPA: IrrE protein [Siphoviridae sp. ctnNB1]
MSAYIDKESLYKRVQNIRNQLKITFNDYPIDSQYLCRESLGKKIGYAPFKTPALRGIASLDKSNPKNDVILLNKFRSKVEQNFDCAHEFIHTVAHRKLQDRTSFSCFETVTKKQDPFIEWQANEGAAELLVPYKDFIPTYITLSQKNARNWYGTPPLKELSERYNVTETVIQNRISSLNYEIYQYMEHGDINRIEILSQNKQTQIGWNRSHEQHYCLSCLAPVNVIYNYCPVCGTKIETEGLISPNYVLKGAGYMKYPGVKLNESLRPYECPNCRNEEIENDSEYCAICGSYILNTCTNQPVNCGHAFDPLPGNARYCPYCGAETTYLQNDFIEKVKDDTHKTTTAIDTTDVTYVIADEDIPF